MKTLSYFLLAALLLTTIFGFIMIIGEPVEGSQFDCFVGIVSMKLGGACCMVAGIYGIKKLFS